MNRSRKNVGKRNKGTEFVNSFWESEPFVDRGLERVHERTAEIIKGSRGFIRPYLEEMLTQQGKMLRPACLLLAFHAGEHGGGNEDHAVDLAAGIEMIHTASLVHDDIIDGSSVRRGESTLHSRIGNRKAVVAGDYLLARAFSLLTGLSDENISAEKVSDRISRLCESEIDQDSEAGDFSISVQHYLRRIGGKTASLFSLACYLGAQAGKLSPMQVRRLSKFGYNLGMSFQIQDDVLDYLGSRTDMGKETGKDLREGIATLPIICACSKDSSGKLAAMLSGYPDLDVKAIINRTKELGGLSDAQAYARRYLRLAEGELKGLPNTEAKMILQRLAQRLSSRRR